ncbi:MAG: T9SS type A sorting domain-containing protein [Chitinophagales bacterium]|nr:T9SS type A sorting domain-containing protein [Chitinophagales bacterium]
MRTFYLPLLFLLKSLLDFTPCTAQAPTAGLLAYWTMDGNFNCNSPVVITGSNNGATATTNKSGLANTAMAFLNPSTNSAQYGSHPITSGLNFSGTQNFSFSFSVFINPGITHAYGLYDNNLNYGGPGVFIWNSNGFIQLHFNYKNLSLGSTNGGLNTGSWRSITCTRNAGTLRIYIDGLLNASGAEGSSAVNYLYPGKFGTLWFDSPGTYNYAGHNGKMDEFRIYNRALTVQEIGQIAAITLPLKLGDFSASTTAQGIDLNWETLSEHNSSHFDVEKSTDGIHFLKIGEQKAAGSANQKTRYHFTDGQPTGKTLFYRLRMADLDQTFTYSRIITVNTTFEKTALRLSPNPARDVIQAQYQVLRAENVQLLITNAAGRIVFRSNKSLQQGSHTFSLPLLTYAPGYYQLSIISETGRISSGFIKE